ncbi:MAG: DNA alkylation repair protein [Gemmatimonadota bacterium]
MQGGHPDDAAHLNNWDLVDASAGYIVGPHTSGDDSGLLSKLAHSKNLWERRIAIERFPEKRRKAYLAGSV